MGGPFQGAAQPIEQDAKVLADATSFSTYSQVQYILYHRYYNRFHGCTESDASDAGCPVATVIDTNGCGL